MNRRDDIALLDRAFARLDDQLPGWLARFLAKLRSERLRWVRIPVGVLFIAASAVWFLPVVGIEFLPIGLLLIAQDVPFLRRPTAKAVNWAVDKWIWLKDWWRGHRRKRRSANPSERNPGRDGTSGR